MKSFCIIIIHTFSIYIFSQESTLKIHSFELGIGYFDATKSISFQTDSGYYTDSYGIGGFSGLVGLTTAYNEKHLIAASFIGGKDFCILCDKAYSMEEFRLQYGREKYLQKWFKVDLYAGIGYYNIKKDGKSPLEIQTISLPISGSMKFYFNHLSGLGVNLNYSINNQMNYFSTHLIFTFRFNQ